MKLSITLGDADIKSALVAHAKQSLKLDLVDDQVKVEITAGRKGKGYSAEIVIGSDETETTAPVESDTVTETTDTSAENSDVDLPTPTPETAGHESSTGTSLFDN